MITESVRTILGEDLATQVETALKGKGKDGKDVDLVVGNDGSFVPAEKFNGANSGKTSAENALKAAAEALKAIGGSGDPAKIADDVKTAQTTIDTLRSDHQKEIARIQKNTALRLALSDKAHDPADIISLLDLDKIEVDDAGGLKTDLDGLLKPLKETKSYLFKDQEPAKDTNIKGAKPADPGARQEPAAKVDGPVVI
ncbi:MAG: phage scaffolding protein [Oscillospiraceae bacterium]